MSRRCSKNVRATGCNHCKNLGENWHVHQSHNAVDTKGRVVCPKILANRCNKCDRLGHLPSRCPGASASTSVNLSARIDRLINPRVQEKPKTVTVPKSENSFSALEDSGSEDVSPPRQSARTMNWAEMSDSDEE